MTILEKIEELKKTNDSLNVSEEKMKELFGEHFDEKMIKSEGLSNDYRLLYCEDDVYYCVYILENIETLETGFGGRFKKREKYYIHAVEKVTEKELKSLSKLQKRLKKELALIDGLFEHPNYRLKKLFLE